MSEARLTRRGLITGLVAVLGALAARAAEAFTLRDRLRFRAASELLDDFGVTVHGAAAGGHDVLILDVVPRPELQYDQVVRERTRAGEIVPCLRTSVFGGVEELSLFDPDSGALDPCLRTTRRGDEATFEHFHPLVSGREIVPCLRTTVTAHTQASFALFDLTESDIEPCFRVESVMSEEGALRSVEITVDPAEENFTVRVGGLVYRLVGGELVPDTRVPA